MKNCQHIDILVCIKNVDNAVRTIDYLANRIVVDFRNGSTRARKLFKALQTRQQALFEDLRVLDRADAFILCENSAQLISRLFSDSNSCQ